MIFFLVKSSAKTCQGHILPGITRYSRGGHGQSPEQSAVLSQENSKKHEILQPGNTKSNTNHNVYTIAAFLNCIPVSALSLGLMVPAIFILLSTHGYCHCVYG